MFYIVSTVSCRMCKESHRELSSKAREIIALYEESKDLSVWGPMKDKSGTGWLLNLSYINGIPSQKVGYYSLEEALQELEGIIGGK